MSKLEDLVPPLELCKLIPKGEFEDSYFVWFQMYQGETHRLLRRDLLVNDTNAISAPTLQEILKELPPYAENEQILACCVPDWADFNARIFGEHWRVGYTGDASICDKSPATAALKLWLELKGIEYEK